MDITFGLTGTCRRWDQRMTQLLAIVEWLESVLNSAFAIAILGGFVGAAGGALAAQQIAERVKRREDLLKELRNTNAAIVVSFSICNAGMALKKQHVQPMHEQFGKEKELLHEFLAKRSKGIIPANAEHQIAADLRSYPAPTTALETLKGLVFEKISAYGRALALVSVLDQSLVGLREAIAKRDAWAHRFSSGGIPKNTFQHYYLGLQLPSGDTNQEYPDLIFAIHSYTDDVIFFSSLLCADLIKHGEAVREPLTRKSENGVPRVSTADFAGPRASGLLPPDDQYADWLNGFTEQKAAT